MLSQIVFPERSNLFMIYLFYMKWDTQKLVFLKSWPTSKYSKLQISIKIVMHTDNLCGGFHISENVSNTNLSGYQNERINH